MNDPAKLTAWERWELASLEPEAAPRPPHPLKPADTPSAPATGASLAPADAGTDVPAEEIVRLPTVEEIETIRRQARDEGFAQGRAEGERTGFKEGQAKAQKEAQRLAQAATTLEQGLAAIDGQIADEVLALAIDLAREVVRQEIAARPETLLAVVREALGQLPHLHAAIYLHPEDASLLRSYLGDQLSHAGHRIHEDAKLARGDCILEAGGTRIDACVATRWRRVLANLGLAAAWAVPPPGDADAS